MGATIIQWTPGHGLSNLGSEIDVLVALSASGPDFLAIVQGQLRHPSSIVLPTWLYECDRLNQRLQLEPFRLSPLLGLQVCFTGFMDPDERDALPQHALNLGATVHKDMIKKSCTHLVAKAAVGAKYTHAISWGTVSVVGLSWLTDCVRFGVRQDESAHPPPQPPPTAAPSAPSAPVNNPQAQPLCNPPVNNSNHTDQHQGTGPGGSAGGGGGREGGQAAGAGGSSDRDPHKSTNPTNFHPAPREDPNPHLPLPSPPSRTPSYFYLPWIRLHLMGCTRDETREAVRLCCECGAVREPELHPEITHVVVGSDPSPSQLSHLRDHLAIWTHCLPIKINWLQHCVTLGRHVEARGTSWTLPTSALTPNLTLNPPATDDARHQNLIGRASSLIAVPSVSMAAAGGGGGGGGGGPNFYPNPRGHQKDVPPSSSTIHPAPAPSTTPASAPGSNTRGSLLKGYFFTLSALTGSEEERVGNQLIICNGGKVFTASNVSKAPADPNLVFALCPHSLPSDKAQLLEKQCEDFRKVRPSNRVTLYWLRMSIEANQLRPYTARQAPAFRPLPFHLPISAFQGLRVHATAYDPGAKAAIKVLVGLLGGTYTESFSRTNTHLLIPESAVGGDKLKMANKFKIPTVTASWLIESCYRGQPLGCEGFIPKGPDPPPPPPQQQVEVNSRATARDHATSFFPPATAEVPRSSLNSLSALKMDRRVTPHPPQPTTNPPQHVLGQVYQHDQGLGGQGGPGQRPHTSSLSKPVLIRNSGPSRSVSPIPLPPPASTPIPPLAAPTTNPSLPSIPSASAVVRLVERDEPVTAKPGPSAAYHRVVGISGKDVGGAGEGSGGGGGGGGRVFSGHVTSQHLNQSLEGSLRNEPLLPTQLLMINPADLRPPPSDLRPPPSDLRPPPSDLRPPAPPPAPAPTMAPPATLPTPSLISPSPFQAPPPPEHQQGIGGLVGGSGRREDYRPMVEGEKEGEGEIEEGGSEERRRSVESVKEPAILPLNPPSSIPPPPLSVPSIEASTHTHLQALPPLPPKPIPIPIPDPDPHDDPLPLIDLIQPSALGSAGDEGAGDILAQIHTLIAAEGPSGGQREVGGGMMMESQFMPLPPPQLHSMRSNSLSGPLAQQKDTSQPNLKRASHSVLAKGKGAGLPAQGFGMDNGGSMDFGIEIMSQQVGYCVTTGQMLSEKLARDRGESVSGGGGAGGAGGGGRGGGGGGGAARGRNHPLPPHPSSSSGGQGNGSGSGKRSGGAGGEDQATKMSSIVSQVQGSAKRRKG